MEIFFIKFQQISICVKLHIQVGVNSKGNYLLLLQSPFDTMFPFNSLHSIFILDTEWGYMCKRDNM